jgi:hypothetical protein
VTNRPPIRFAFYNRVCKEDEQDAEAAREQLARCRAIIESLGWKMAAVYADSGESPYRRTINQPERAQEKPIP